MIRRATRIAFVVLVFAGCAQPPAVVLTNPAFETGMEMVAFPDDQGNAKAGA